MGEKVYRIKALEWETTAKSSFAESPWGSYLVWTQDGAKWQYADSTLLGRPCEDRADGKARCEALYRERMERGLEVVE